MPTQIETVSCQSHTYTIRMGGSLDGVNARDPVGGSPFEQAYEPNRFVRMENVGDTEVVNPWIVVNGKRDWRSLDRILDGILEEGMSDEEKARAIWEFARTHRYHFTSATDEVKDTVKMLNVYGYTLCWDEAYTVSNLWQAAGLKVRRGYPHGHCTTEVFYDGEYHLLDSDEHLLYLMRDNRTVASEADLARDRDLVKRGHAYGILQRENADHAEGTAALFFFTGPRTGGRPLIGDHTMDLTLRPGESMLWEWEDRGKFHGHWDRPKRLCNGRMQYQIDLSTLTRWADRAEGWVGNAHGLVPETPGGACLELTIRSPYVIVGGKLDLGLQRGVSDDVRVSVSLDGKNWSPLKIPDGQLVDASLDLDAVLRPDAPAVYAYHIRVDAAETTDLTITRLDIETDLQMAPLSLPALEVGENSVRYTADSEGQMKIEHSWEEQEASPPRPPQEPVFPPEGQMVPGTRFTFSWPDVEDAVDYQFELSDRDDLKYKLSPVFEKLVSLTPSAGLAEWKVPFEGLLNPHQSYHWRVRPRNELGLWGAWSPTWSFTPIAPGVPLSLNLEPDWDDRTLTLSWAPDSRGTPPDHYEIYGSNERGFTASREPQSLMVSNDERKSFPPNLLTSTRATNIQVAGPSVEAGNFAFYRVVAVDGNGIRSGPSDYVEAPRPMIVSVPGPAATGGKTYKYQIRAIEAEGELQAERVEGQNYVRAIRERDELRFLIDEGPFWTEIDEHTGLFTARPDAKHAGFHTITVRVQNGRGGTDMQGFDLEVIV